MSADFKHSRNEHGDPVLTITVVGFHDIFRLQWNLLHAQVEFSAAARKTFQWMRASLGPKRYDAFDQTMTGGKTRGYSIRPKRSEYGNTTLAFLLTLATLCAVAWFAVPNVPGVVEAMTVGVLRILGYGVGGCVGVAMSWRWIERAL